MKKIIAINGSPRSGWNTDILVREAADGAASADAAVEIIDLYKLEKYTGCISCFGCKTEAHLGKCICRDGLADVLEKIRTADGFNTDLTDFAIFPATGRHAEDIFHIKELTGIVIGLGGLDNAHRHVRLQCHQTTCRIRKGDNGLTL